MLNYPRWVKCIYFVALLFLQACTYSIIMTHTEGSAVDTVDQAQDAEPNLSPTITFPKVY